MASNNISKYYKVDNGLDLTSDSQFATLSANEKIVYKPSGEKYIKNSNYSNVFDKTDTFGELESNVNTTVTKLEEKVDTNITKLEEKVDTKVIAKIDDADGNGVCSCKNNNNTQIDTFTCHISKTSNNPILSWGQESTIGTVDGTPLTVKMPTNPSQDLTEYISTHGYNPTGDSRYRVFLEYHTKLVDGSSNPEQWSETGWYIVVRSPRTGLPYEKYLIFTNPPRTSDSGSGSTSGERYGNMWYVESTSNGLKPSSSIYSDFTSQGAIGGYGCSGPIIGTGTFLTGDHPPSGTYYCEIISGVTGSSSISGCFIYTTTL